MPVLNMIASAGNTNHRSGLNCPNLEGTVKGHFGTVYANSSQEQPRPLLSRLSGPTFGGAPESLDGKVGPGCLFSWRVITCNSKRWDRLILPLTKINFRAIIHIKPL